MNWGSTIHTQCFCSVNIFHTSRLYIVRPRMVAARGIRTVCEPFLGSWSPSWRLTLTSPHCGGLGRSPSRPFKRSVPRCNGAGETGKSTIFRIIQPSSRESCDLGQFSQTTLLCLPVGFTLMPLMQKVLCRAGMVHGGERWGYSPTKNVPCLKTSRAAGLYL